ncbi:multidrug and toxin extrusion protein 2-like [Rana temporaria]|uniref:multidrug and toxin extrusion protein 2-like n=1 Tax=Rana temporaria TaxID=8407 RepID=UPI001AAD5136|nr:multidrug and toxin extrusion protein 2-like [Rana temporaria]
MTGNGGDSGELRTDSGCMGGRMIRRALPLYFWPEVKELCVLAGPVFLSQILVYSISIVSSIFCGHLGKIELDSVTLAVAVINVTGISVGSGLSSACDTLMSQTYGGKNLKRVGTVLQRGILILMLCCFPCWAIFINTEQVLLLCRQNPDVARLTQQYVMIFIPALPAAFLFQLQIRYLQNQNIIWPQVITGFAVNLINAAVNAIFMYGFKLGVEGSAWANTLSQFAMSGVLFAYIIIKKLHVSTWGGWSMDCLQEWGLFMRLAIPSMLMVCIEWWSFEIGGFLAGVISVVELGAQAIMLELATSAYMVAVGLSVAANVRIGNALGAGNVEQAKTSCKVVLVCIVFCSLVSGSLLAGLKDVIAYMFTSDREIVTLVSNLMLIFVPFHLCDAIAGTCAGILRGTGKQKIGAITNAVGFYLVGLPIGITLMFAAKLGVMGLWIGMIFPVFMQASFFVVYVLRMNWDKVSQEAQIRAGVKSEKKNPVSSTSAVEYSITQFDAVTNGDVQSCHTGYSIVDQDFTGAVIVPDIGFSHTEHLVLEEDSSLEAVNVVGEALSTKQLILRRGPVVFLAVIMLLIGVIVRLLTGNG